MLHECTKKGGVEVEYIGNVPMTASGSIISFGPESSRYREDYQSLTKNNFFVVLTNESLQVATSTGSSSQSTFSARADYVQLRSYNASTGELTLTGCLKATQLRAGSSMAQNSTNRVYFDLFIVKPGLDVIKGS